MMGYGAAVNVFNWNREHVDSFMAMKDITSVREIVTQTTDLMNLDDMIANPADFASMTMADGAYVDASGVRHTVQLMGDLALIQSLDTATGAREARLLSRDGVELARFANGILNVQLYGFLLALFGNDLYLNIILGDELPLFNHSEVVTDKSFVFVGQKFGIMRFLQFPT